MIDLTNILKKVANENTSKGIYVYWRDDTHWNDFGIKIAADYIAKHLN